jgi:molecular chaperone GrpE
MDPKDKNTSEEKAEKDLAPETTETAENQESPEKGAGADLATELARLNEKYLRLYSDFENFKKRSLKEKIEFSKYANEEFIKGLLPVLDDIDRGLSALEQLKAGEEVINGLALIRQKLFGFLQQKGVSEINAKGELFDTEFHEAISELPAPNEAQQGRVLEVAEKGYTFHGKVIRFAKVLVGK